MLSTVRSLKKPALSLGARALSVPTYVPDLKAQTAKPKVRSYGSFWWFSTGDHGTDLVGAWLWFVCACV